MIPTAADLIAALPADAIAKKRAALAKGNGSSPAVTPRVPEAEEIEVTSESERMSAYSRGTSKFDNAPEQRSADGFEAFAEAVLADVSPRKGLAFVCAPMAAGLHSNPEQHPGERSWRQKHLIRPRDWLPFDLDLCPSAEIFEQIKAWFGQFQGFGYATASHTPAAPRARFIVALSRPANWIEGEQLGRTLQRWITAALGEAGTSCEWDTSVYSGWQPVFTPTVGSSSFSFLGEPVEVDDVLSRMAPEDRQRPRWKPQESGDNSRRATTTGIIGEFNATHRPAEILTAQGYSEFPGGRWLHPNSSSGEPGLILYPDGLAYSFNETDPLATPGDDGERHAHDAFSLFRVLEHGGDLHRALQAARGTQDHGRKFGEDDEEPNAATEDDDGAQKVPHPPQRDKLIACVADCEFWRDSDGNAYATVQNNGHREHYAVRAKAFRDYMARRYYRQHGGAPSAAATEDALRVLEATARFERKEHAVYTRIAEVDGSTYVDLANAAWEVVRVTPAGWEVALNPPVKFLRPRGMRPLPRPVGGDGADGAALLRKYLNVTDDDQFKLVVGWMVAAFGGRGPYPALELTGEQGTAKSTSGRVVRACVDPNVALLRAPPRREEDVIIAGRNGWVLAYDNLSHLPPWLSDALCRVSTGGGFGTRELYTDTDEVLVDIQRPQIITSINPVATRGDLADRKITAVLEVIPDDRRKPEAVLWREFEADQPRIVGWLLNAVAGSLRELPHTRLAKLPRMADFALRVTAAERALGWETGAFLKVYAGERLANSEMVVDGDPVGHAIRDLMARRSRWEGSASDLLADLNKIVSREIGERDSWPKGATALSKRVTRLAADLRAIGIDVDFGHAGRGSTKRRAIKLRREAQSSDPSVPSVPVIDSKGKSGDGCGDARTDGDASGDAGVGPHGGENPNKNNDGDAGDAGDAESATVSTSYDGNGSESPPHDDDDYAPVERPEEAQPWGEAL